MDLTSKIATHGTVTSRGEEAIRLLRQFNWRSGFFLHNGVRIDVYPDSSIRELIYLYTIRIRRTDFGR